MRHISQSVDNQLTESNQIVWSYVLNFNGGGGGLTEAARATTGNKLVPTRCPVDECLSFLLLGPTIYSRVQQEALSLPSLPE